MTTEQTHDQRYQKVQELAEAGLFEPALALLRDYLSDYPNDVEANNDAGAILFALERYDEAIDHLKQAIRHAAGNVPGETLWNLAETYLAARRPHEAASLFDDLVRAELFNPDLANRAANLFLGEQDYAMAVDTLLLSLRIYPAQDTLDDILASIKQLRPALAILWDKDEYRPAESILRWAERRFRLTARKVDSADEIRDEMSRCGMLWLESDGPMARAAADAPRTCSTVLRIRNNGTDGAWLADIDATRFDMVLVPDQGWANRLTVTNPELRDKALVLVEDCAVDLQQVAQALYRLERKPRLTPRAGKGLRVQTGIEAAAL